MEVLKGKLKEEGQHKQEDDNDNEDDGNDSDEETLLKELNELRDFVNSNKACIRDVFGIEDTEHQDEDDEKSDEDEDMDNSRIKAKDPEIVALLAEYELKMRETHTQFKNFL